VSGDLEDADLQAWLDGRHAQVQGVHEKSAKAKAFFQKLAVLAKSPCARRPGGRG
jgi:hypothetical protein